MLISYALLLLFVLSSLASPALGTAREAGAAVLQGAEEALRFTLAIGGGICLWSGVMELMERCGISTALARGLRPVLKRLFPLGAGRGEILSALAENVSANLLGLGNAATPAGIRAARGIARLDQGREAENELCLLVVLNTASIQILPTTIASIRAAAGAVSPFDILPAVWFSSALALSAGLGAAWILRRLWP